MHASSYYCPLLTFQLAVQMPKVPLDPFRACIFSAPEAADWAYGLQVSLAGIHSQQSPGNPEISHPYRPYRLRLHRRLHLKAQS